MKFLATLHGALALSLLPLAGQEESVAAVLEKARALGDLSSLDSVSLRATSAIAEVARPRTKTPPTPATLIALLEQAAGADQNAAEQPPEADALTKEG